MTSFTESRGQRGSKGVTYEKPCQVKRLPRRPGPSRVSMDYSSVTYACSSAHEKMGHRPANQLLRDKGDLCPFSGGTMGKEGGKYKARAQGGGLLV